jgi:hypothetical protein
MTTILVVILWVGGSGVSPVPTSLSVEFDQPAACADARDGIAARLKGTNTTFVAECFPKGEIRT